MATLTMPTGEQAVVPLTPKQIPGQVDLLISLHLHFWQALTIAIQNGWGTSDPKAGEDKRDWFAGAISELLDGNQLQDLDDLEEVLGQVMFDEFDVVVEDGTLEEVSRKIWKGVALVKSGEGREVTQLLAAWQERKQRGEKIVGIVQGKDANTEDDDDDDDDDSTDDGEEEEWNGFQDSSNRGTDAMDVDMEEAPTLIQASKKPEPEVDEDGFTKVVSKKKR